MPVNSVQEQAQQIVEGERRWSTWVLIAGAADVDADVHRAGDPGPELAKADDAEHCSRSRRFGSLLTGAIVTGLGIAGSASRFRPLPAAGARNAQMRPALGPLILGAILLGLSGVMQVVALDQVAATS